MRGILIHYGYRRVGDEGCAMLHPSAGARFYPQQSLKASCFRISMLLNLQSSTGILGFQWHQLRCCLLAALRQRVARCLPFSMDDRHGLVETERSNDCRTRAGQFTMIAFWLHQSPSPHLQHRQRALRQGKRSEAPPPKPPTLNDRAKKNRCC